MLQNFHIFFVSFNNLDIPIKVETFNVSEYFYK